MAFLSFSEDTFEMSLTRKAGIQHADAVCKSRVLKQTLWRWRPLHLHFYCLASTTFTKCVVGGVGKLASLTWLANGGDADSTFQTSFCISRCHPFKAVEIFYSLAKAVTKVHIADPDPKKFAQNCMRIY